MTKRSSAHIAAANHWAKRAKPGPGEGRAAVSAQNASVAGDSGAGTDVSASGSALEGSGTASRHDGSLDADSKTELHGSGASGNDKSSAKSSTKPSAEPKSSGKDNSSTKSTKSARSSAESTAKTASLDSVTETDAFGHSLGPESRMSADSPGKGGSDDPIVILDIDEDADSASATDRLSSTHSAQAADTRSNSGPKSSASDNPGRASDTLGSGTRTSPIHLLHNSSYELRNSSPPINADTVAIADLVGMPDLVHTYQFNFSVDVALFLGYLHPQFVRHGKVTFVTGSALLSTTDEEVVWAKSTFSLDEVVVLVPRFGSHHTKMMINVFADSSVEIVIMTCNLTKLDFAGLTQMVWRSGRLAKHGPNYKGTQVGNRFAADMERYLRSYRNSVINSLADSLRNYDYLGITIELVASVPGHYDMKDMTNDSEIYGYGKFRQVLRRNDLLLDDSDTKKYNVLAQVTSIAYPYAQERHQTASILTHLLGPLIFSSAEFHLLKPGLAACRDHQRDHNYRLHLLFPTVGEVAGSTFGFMSGSAVHLKYAGAGAHKDQFDQNIRPYLCRWSAGSGRSGPKLVTGREEITPHTKIYASDNGDNWRSLRWILVGSHNLSRQAWGEPDRRRAQGLDPAVYDVSSYELSVFIRGPLTPVYGKDTLDGGTVPIRLPFMVPPKKYQPTDQAWSGHLDHGTVRDTWGNTYKP